MREIEKREKEREREIEREKESQGERERYKRERERDCNYPQTQTFLIFFRLDSNEYERQSPATLKCKSMKRTLIENTGWTKTDDLNG